MLCCVDAVAGSLALQNEQHVPANSSIGLMQVVPAACSQSCLLDPPMCHTDHLLESTC